MKKLSLPFFVLGLSLGVASFGILLHAAGGNVTHVPQLAQAVHTHQGNHYIGKPATTEEEGIREYWVCCLCHEAFFDSQSDDVHNGEWVETGVTADHGEGGVNEDAIIPRIVYEYEEVQGGLKLTKYLGEYTSLITVPADINGMPVVSIAQGCFVKEDNPQPQNRIRKLNDPAIQEEETDYSAFYINESIEEIEAGAFDMDHTFLTNSKSKKENWHDEAIYGDAKAGTAESSAYYDVLDGESKVHSGIVYVYDRSSAGYYVARCLTNRKNVVVPSHIGGIPVQAIGPKSFYMNTHIRKISLPDTIGIIRSRAFAYCENLVEIDMDCPNLTSIVSRSFAYCTSLEVIKLPPNLHNLSQILYGCETLRELYIPVSVETIYASLILEVFIEHIYYAGTQEQWEAAAKALIPELPPETQVHIGAEVQPVATIDHLSEIADLPSKTLVTATAIITGYTNFTSNYTALMITDDYDMFSIECYVNQGLPFNDLNYIGKTVEVTGNKTVYFGALQLTDCTFNVLEKEPIKDLTPIPFPKGTQYNPEDYNQRYCSIRGTISEFDKKTASIYLSEYPGLSFYGKNYYRFYEPRIGDLVEASGWIVYYNQVCDLKYDPRCVRILNHAEPIEEPQSEEISISDLIALPRNSDNAYIVEGIVSWGLGGSTMELQDKESGVTIQVNWTSCSESSLVFDGEAGRYRFRPDIQTNDVCNEDINEGDTVRMKVVSYLYRGSNNYWGIILSYENGPEPTAIIFPEGDQVFYPSSLPSKSRYGISFEYYPSNAPKWIEVTVSDPSIAEVELDLIHKRIYISLYAEGTTTITLTTSGGVEASVTITVILD